MVEFSHYITGKLAFFGRSKGESAFTLIELMVAVAIIAVMSSIAIPNFRKITNKSRQAEAKINLACLYAAEKEFYGDYDAYVPDVKAIGFAPEGSNSGLNTNPKAFYYIGWNGNTYANTITGYSGGFSNSQIQPHQAPTSWGSCPFSPADPTAAPYNVDSPQSYTASAHAMLPGATTCDVWTIDDLKFLKNKYIGL